VRERMSKKKEEKKSEKKLISVSNLLVVTLYHLLEKAWAYLGLVSHAETGEKLVDLDEARLAIDTIEFLKERIKEKIPPEELKNLEFNLSNLRLNFISKAREKEKRG